MIEKNPNNQTGYQFLAFNSSPNLIFICKIKPSEATPPVTKHGTSGCYKDLQLLTTALGYPLFCHFLLFTCQQHAKEDVELGIRQTTQLRWGTEIENGTMFGENNMV